MKVSVCSIAVSVFLALLGTAQQAHAQVSFNFPGGFNTIPHQLNNNGDLVGVSVGATTRGFERLADGTLIGPIIHPNDNVGFTRALGINDSGLIVGDYETFNGTSFAFHGFTYDGTTFTTYNIGGPVSTSLWAVNNAGDVAGVFGSNVQTNQALVIIGGVTTTFAGPGNSGTGTFAFGINNVGEVVGQFTNGTGTHGFFRTAGGILNVLDVPGAILTTAAGINDAGVIVGTYRDSSNVAHGFFKTSAGYATYDFPGATNTFLGGINNAGTLDGNYLDPSGANHGFITENVVPEGSSMALLLMGLLAPGAVLLRRRQKSR